MPTEWNRAIREMSEERGEDAQRPSAASCSKGEIPERFAEFLRNVRDNDWEYGDGTLMAGDAQAAIEWIAARGGMSL